MSDSNMRSLEGAGDAELAHGERRDYSVEELKTLPSRISRLMVDELRRLHDKAKAPDQHHIDDANKLVRHAEAAINYMTFVIRSNQYMSDKLQNGVGPSPYAASIQRFKDLLDA